MNPPGWRRSRLLHLISGIPWLLVPPVEVQAGVSVSGSLLPNPERSEGYAHAMLMNQLRSSLYQGDAPCSYISVSGVDCGYFVGWRSLERYRGGSNPPVKPQSLVP